MTNSLHTFRVKGSAILPYVSDVARLRGIVFKDYPYLYETTQAYEENYLKTYIDSSESVFVLIADGDKIVGASTAIPLALEEKCWQNPFLEAGQDIDEIFYFGESVLLHEYRGRHLYRHFFQQREAAAREYGSKTVTFSEVERSLADPRRPENYQSLDRVWTHFGYEKHAELKTQYGWPDIGEKENSFKTMIFWLKTL